MWKISNFSANISLEWLWRTISNACCCCGCWIRKKRLWIPLQQPWQLPLQYYIKPPSQSQREKAALGEDKIPPRHRPPSFLFPLWNFSFSFTKLFPLLLDFPIWLWLVFAVSLTLIFHPFLSVCPSSFLPPCCLKVFRVEVCICPPPFSPFTWPNPTPDALSNGVSVLSTGFFSHFWLFKRSFFCLLTSLVMLLCNFKPAIYELL